MFPQTHNNITGLELEQMLHFLSSNSPIPLPTSMDHHHHHHRSTNSSSNWKPHIEIAPNCPRCASTNTKFCYYNNYSLSQPRYFCKACRRYWTKGGSLRNVPVGGGCRKTRRSKSSRNLHSDRHGSEDIGIGDGDHQQNQTNASRDIDMAVVFAKFLNQNSTSGGESNNNNNNLSTTSESVETETENDAVVQPLMCTSDQPLVVGGGDTFEEMRTLDEVQNFGREELSLSGMDEFEGLLSVDDDVVQDILWSDHDHDAIVPSSSNTWQQQQQQPPSMMQMHELDQLVSYSLPLNEDCHELLHVNSSSTVNLISDSWSSWSSFDISNMEVFTSSSGGP